MKRHHTEPNTETPESIVAELTFEIPNHLLEFKLAEIVFEVTEIEFGNPPLALDLPELTFP